MLVTAPNLAAPPTGTVREMDRTLPHPVALADEFDRLTFLPGRTPRTSDESAGDAFARLADYRDGAVFIAHWAGESEWERHPVGDEVVMIVDGATTMSMLIGGDEQRYALTRGDLVVVPQGTWHRFHAPDGVKVMTVTPQPTDHSADLPVPGTA